MKKLKKYKVVMFVIVAALMILGTSANAQADTWKQR